MGEIDYQRLKSRIDEVGAVALRLEQGVGQVGLQVAHVGQQNQETMSRLDALAREIAAFRLENERAGNVQRATTEIVGVKAELEHQYGHYNKVRRVALGILEGFDQGLISENQVRGVSETLVMETPGYWLAPVLVAMRAWWSDDPATCERALHEAIRRSPRHTALFMALLLRRQGRAESSLRWLRHYLAALDPAALGREFAMVLESVSQGAFGPAGVRMIAERLDIWREHLLHDENAQTAQVGRWRQELERYVGPSSATRFPRLAAVSPQWPLMDTALGRADAHDRLIATYSAMTAEEITAPDRLEDQVDDILDGLVRGYDDEELPLRRQHAEYQAIVEHNGDTAAAKRALQTDLLALDKTLDYLTIQSEAALNPGKLGVSRATQRTAVSSCHDWFARAHAAYSAEYRAALPTNVEAVFEGSHQAAGRVFQLPRWTGSFTEPMEALEASLNLHWNRAAQPFIDSLAYKWGTNLIGPIALAVIGTICGAAVSPVLIIFVLLAAGVWGAVLYSQSLAAAKRQDEVRALLEQAKQDSLEQLRAAGAEVVDWTSAFQQADRREPAVRELIADLATAGSTATPYERRVVGDGAQVGA
ncbi:hypothetical protein [Actinoplanes sp. NPDC051411]|uniref:hypothetical protein n=1 Tax=Actinoplanes sp. NPDC051411 TaxID=3155522 RepID=UPI00341D605C